MTIRLGRTPPAPAPSSPPALDVHSLTVAYVSAGRRLVALRGASLALRPGEILGLVGPNGSGKTTLLRAVSGAVRPVSGTVRLLGDDVSRLAQREIALRAAVVPQEPALPPAFAALDCVLMGRTPHLRLLQGEGAADFRAARDAMLATGTWDLAGRPAGELSGGERQRLVIARALAQQTPVLLLDEPTAHLDIGHQASVLGLMRTLCRREAKAVLAVIHDLTLAAQFCDRLVLLCAGEVIAHGPPAAVLRADLLARVYGTAVAVFPHPQTGRPVVAPGGAEG
ncbi:MAG: ABC transporter ATP-binding protein [Dehalococcoidia bacterium]|nr:ABC transporter ATP-binding protein [Dehalococcoidia bacterium]